MRKILLLVFVALSAITASAQIKSVDDLVGNYTDAYDYAAIWSDWTNWEKASYTAEVNITKTGDNTITISNLGNWGLDFVATVDLTAGTITIPAQTVWSYYIACALPENVTYGALYADPCVETAAIVGTINQDGTLSINWCASYYSSVVMTTKSVLTKTEAKLEWSRQGAFIFMDETGDAATEFYKTTATLEKWSGKDYQYQITGFSAYNPNPSTIQFNVTAEGNITLLNGWYSQDNGAFFYYIMNNADDLWLTGGEVSSFTASDNSVEACLDYEYFASYNDDDATSAGTLKFVWDNNSTAISSISGTEKNVVRKFIQNGSVVIVKDGHKYNALGTEIK